ncbi:Aldehyde dehydrogenase family 2 member C4 [Morus notabilis]|uniref:Aldehyde dehydrogenase family 2 member C4 n=1 Tax=Morus notabilis TaxID=981085 RepID=W9RT17_9ROSA|nr:Aldehyde dehydrogenase family 2 member C4 [Morus notabilis]
MLIVKDEIFGPVVGLMSSKTKINPIPLSIKEISISCIGLAAGVVTKDLNVANTASRSIRAGTICINCHFALRSSTSISK